MFSKIISVVSIIIEKTKNFVIGLRPVYSYAVVTVDKVATAISNSLMRTNTTGSTALQKIDEIIIENNQIYPQVEVKDIIRNSNDVSVRNIIVIVHENNMKKEIVFDCTFVDKYSIFCERFCNECRIDTKRVSTGDPKKTLKYVLKLRREINDIIKRKSLCTESWYKIIKSVIFLVGMFFALFVAFLLIVWIF